MVRTAKSAEYLGNAGLDEVFGLQNFVATLVWQKKYAPANDAKYFSDDHDYVYVYAKKKAQWSPNKLARSDEQNSRYSNPDNDPRGPWKADNYVSNKNNTERPNGWYEVENPNSGEKNWPAPTAVWRYPLETHKKHIRDNRLWWGQSGKNSVPAYKRFLSEVGGVVPRTVMLHSDVGHTQGAKRQILEIFHGQSEVFATPKPSSLIKRILEVGANQDDLIMDSFAGSGTTGHAVLDLNKQDGGNRKFILVEMDEKIAPEITGERLRRVINGYDKGGDANKPVEGLGGGFRYCRLGTPLFDEFGDIDGAVAFPDLAAHVFFSETGSPIPQRVDGSTPLIGKHGEQVVYLLYSEPEQGFPREEAGNVLTPDMLASLPSVPDDFEGERVVYAEGCTVSPDRLKAEGITFKQIPYNIQGA